MAIIPAEGWMLDPNNSGGVIPAKPQSITSGYSAIPTDSVIPPRPTDLATDQAKAANQGQPGYDVLGNPLAPTSSASTITTGTQNGTQNTTGSPTLPDTVDRTALAQAQADYQRNAKIAMDTITGIQNGATPLNAGEQAQVDGLKQQFQALIDQQNLVNAGASGSANVRGYQKGAAEYDPTFQVKTIGSIVSAGAAKVADLQIKEASAVATLTQSFKDNDIKAVKDAWAMYQDASKERTTALQKTIDDTAKAIKDAQDAKIAADKVVYDTVTKPIQDIQTLAAKNGALPDVLAKIKGATTVQDAITAAGDSLQTATGTLGDYLQYKKDTEAKGLVPTDYQTYKDQQDAKALKAKIAEAYATQTAKNQSDAAFTASDKTQQKLEQQYRQVLAKEFSARTGALGVENAKVNQANHLNSLFKQYYDPKTGNYNIPPAQYAELAIGLASMISPTGQSSDADRAEIKSKTAAGDLNGALTYITGVPQNGNTQAIIKNLIDSVDRQAETAVRNREAALGDMRAQAPTDLEPSRIDALNKSTQMVSYEGQDRISKANVDAYVKANPKEAETIAKLYEVPGATDQDIEAYLKAQGKLQ